jgi:hypothetical protein
LKGVGGMQLCFFVGLGKQTKYHLKTSNDHKTLCKAKGDYLVEYNGNKEVVTCNKCKKLMGMGES